MNILRRKFLELAALAAVLAGIAALTVPAWSAGRTVKIIIPFPPGGAADVLARILADQIGKESGQTMVVENHPGAGASIAYGLTARGARWQYDCGRLEFRRDQPDFAQDEL